MPSPHVPYRHCLQLDSVEIQKNTIRPEMINCTRTQAHAKLPLDATQDAMIARQQSLPDTPLQALAIQALSFPTYLP